MASVAANFRTSMRDTARRTGLADFWRWWTAQLAGVVPASLRNLVARQRLKPIVVFDRDEAILWELDDAGAHRLAYAPGARIPLHGDANEIAQAGRAAIETLRKRARGRAPEVVLALTPHQVLRKRLTYPALVENNLSHVLGYDLDRHTPFKSDELYYDAAIVGRDAARNEIKIELVAALRSVVDQLRRQVETWGAEVVAIAPEVPRGDAAPAQHLDLMPEADRTPAGLRRWQIVVPVVLAIVLAAVAIGIPIANKREEAITLLHQTEQARIQAAGADALRQQLEQSVEDYNFVLSKKYSYPSTVQLLDDVTRILPDDTWLTTLELKSIPKGKEPARKEILLRGESANAGRLVTLLEDSHLFEQAAPRSPTTKIQPGPGEIFDVGAQLKPLPMPAPVPIAVATAPASNAPGSAANAAANAALPAGVANAAPRPSAPAASAPPANASKPPPASFGPLPPSQDAKRAQ